MITLNLLPDVKIEYLKTKKAQARVIGTASLVTIIAVALVVLLAAYVYGAQTLMRNGLTDDIKENTSALKAIPDIDKYLTLQNQLANITELHNTKTDFSRLMTYLPVLNPAAPNNVTLTEVAVTTPEEEGGVNGLLFKGETKDYTALSTFRDTMLSANLKYEGSVDNEKLFESVVVSRSSLEKSDKGPDVVVFEIQAVYNPNAFLFGAKDPVVTVPHKTTTQSAETTPDVFGKSTTKEDQR